MTVLTVTKYEVVEAGEYVAKVAKLEEVDGQFGKQLKAAFELAEFPGVQVSGWASLKMSPKSKLYGWAKAICYGGEDFEGQFDLDNLLGRACRVVLAVENGSDGQEHNKIIDVFPPRRGTRAAAGSPAPAGPVKVNAAAPGPSEVPPWLNGDGDGAEDLPF